MVVRNSDIVNEAIPVPAIGTAKTQKVDVLSRFSVLIERSVRAARVTTAHTSICAQTDIKGKPCHMQFRDDKR